VALEDGAVEGPRVALHELQDLPEIGRFLRIRGSVLRKAFGQGHGPLF
jgi:hypothetical protein